MTANFDVIVIGLGGWGTSALYHCAKRGARVCGLEQFELNHDRGSSHGDSRLIRMAYFMHPDYVPVLRQAYRLWQELAAETQVDLLKITGLLCVGEPEGSFIHGLESCYRAHQLPHERLSAAEAMRRYPQFGLPDDAVCYFDPLGGYVRPDHTIRATLELARRYGARADFGEKVISWECREDHVQVFTDRRSIAAEKLILAAGAFSGQSEISAPISIQPLRKVLFWYSVKSPERFLAPGFPAWIAKLNDFSFYGFPSLETGIIKAAEDSGGQALESPYGPDAKLQPRDENRLRPFLDRFLGGQLLERTHHKICLYENSSDRHFVIDRHPRWDRVILLCGGSGHGFKFSPVAGEIATDLALMGKSGWQPDIFKISGRSILESPVV